MQENRRSSSFASTVLTEACSYYNGVLILQGSMVTECKSVIKEVCKKKDLVPI